MSEQIKKKPTKSLEKDNVFFPFPPCTNQFIAAGLFKC